jgi:hypothetical protein
MADESKIDIEAAMIDGALVDEALDEAAQDAIEAHRRAGRPMVICRDGQVVWVHPDELDRERRSGEKSGDLPS